MFDIICSILGVLLVKFKRKYIYILLSVAFLMGAAAMYQVTMSYDGYLRRGAIFLYVVFIYLMSKESGENNDN